VQHREYVPGDDTRHIDWKSYGRSERYTIKQYEQETNSPPTSCCDASKSMLYGEGDENKARIREDAGAAMAFVIIHQRDSVASMSSIGLGATGCPPSGAHGTRAGEVLNTLASVKPRDKNAMGRCLHDIAIKCVGAGWFF